MTDTTTIEIREDQRDSLAELKQHGRETYKAVLDRLLDDDEDSDTESGGACDVDAGAISDAVISDLKAQLPNAVADEVETRIG